MQLLVLWLDIYLLVVEAVAVLTMQVEVAQEDFYLTQDFYKQ
jgi:hypothetical protein